jgi:CPA1 family monovalent cation:H+ antiporter
VLFGTGVTYDVMESRIESGAVIRKTNFTAEFDYKQFLAKHVGLAIPLFVVDDAGQVLLFTADKPPTPKAGQSLVSLMSKSEAAAGAGAASAHGPAPTTAPPAPSPVGA